VSCRLVLADTAPPGEPVRERELRLCRDLEAGDILLFSRTPFAPAGDDQAFLLRQRQTDARYHKNIAYRPREDRVTGFAAERPNDADRLRRVMGEYSRRAIAFAAELFPGYARRWRIDYASFRPQEEAGRRLPLRARNDLCHVDSFPTRPSRGDRLLRVFTNVNPTAPRVWLCGGTFDDLAGRFAVSSGLLDRARRPSLAGRLRRLGRALGLPVTVRPPYDEFMLSFHHFLKANAAYQEAEPKVRLDFPPGSTWIVFTDMVSHAVLSGQYALEQTFVVARDSLVVPDKAPIAILERLAGARLA
jgi:3-deoxy-D-manno-octulosonic acid hydroxylase-like protein